MENIINFEEHSMSTKFQKDVISEITKRNPLYDFEQDGDTGIAYMHFNDFVCVFFKYIPRGNATTLLNLDDSFAGKHNEEKYSKGEWFVEEIVSLGKKNSMRIFPLVFSAKKEPGWITSLKKKINEF